MTDTISFSVRGCRPAPWGTKEWEWRKALADCARMAYPPGSLAVTKDATFKVAIVFLLTSPLHQRADLDNLAKPVLDTLFRPNNPQVKDMCLTAALFEVDDHAVTRLVVEKQLVSRAKDEGADITISW